MSPNVAQLRLRRMAAAPLLLFSAFAFGARNEALPPEAEPTTITGTWVAAKDPNRRFFSSADTFRFVLVQTDTLVSGTWGATGPEGVVVKSDQPVTGRIVDGKVQLALTYSRYDHGCTGPLRECYDLYHRFLGELQSPQELQGKVLGPPHPTIPDSQFSPHAEWTLRRQ